MSGTLVLILRIFLALCLYGFLTWAIVTIWRELREQVRLTGAPSIPDLSLSMVNGEENSPITYHSPEILIGRNQNCDYPIPDDTVSARHARLSFHHNHWWVEDFKSTNGTFLNDERVNMPTVIVSGDELRCGQINMLITIAEKNR